VNATGLGKDRPGSPISDNAAFPEEALVWEINYRGSLEFMHQARRQAKERKLLIEDGWMYFIYGWTQVIAEVIHRDIRGELLHRLSAIASET
ncbi:MAG: shikimate dehydrogenase, partial [Clostridiales bacterium]|nr:shikimate dehydrogenase [Clostridiales bacterium]